MDGRIADDAILNATRTTAESIATALDRAVAPVLITDTLGRIAYANRAAAEWIGRPASWVRGRHFAMLMADEGVLPEIDRIAVLVASGRTWSGPIVTRRLDGSLARIGLLLTPIRSSGGVVTHALAVFRETGPDDDIARLTVPTTRTELTVPASLARPDGGQPLAVLAGDVADALLALEGVIAGRIVAFAAGDRAHVLAERRRHPGASGRRMRMRSSQVGQLRALAETGAWIEPRSTEGTHLHRETEMGCADIRAVAYAPLRHAGRVVGLLAVATDDPRGTVALERHLVSLSHFGVLASGLLGPGLAAREHDADLRSEIERVIGERAFATVFQPMVRLADGEAFAYEALTRFSDGTPPERRFSDAETVGLGVKLEVATLSAALDAAGALPAEASVSLNASPPLVMQHETLGPLLRPVRRSVIIEVTEREPIDDYPTFSRAMARLEGVSWAVDDAGAGYASLRHIIELRPGYVKLDRGLVTAIGSDPIRQALVAGMLHFATSIGVRIIAEGVETQAERLTLHALGVEFGQGYLFARPRSYESS